MGCKKETIQVYQAPKDKPAELAAHDHQDVTPPEPEVTRRPAARPKLTYTVPAGWREGTPNQVAVANFSITGPDGQSANVSIAPLPPLANRETEVVNMWRQQMGLGEISKDEADKLLTEVDVAEAKGKMFELASAAGSSQGLQRIITVMQHEPDASWFYKISGDDALVTREKPNFLAFIKSVRFSESAAEPATARSGPASGEGGKGSAWKIPADWQEVAPGPMQNAKFQVPPQKGATAEVTVSVFPSDTGGDLANVNRWRGQLGLNQVDKAALAKIVQPLDSALPGAILVDMENDGSRLVGAIVPRDGRWYFYKLRGGQAAVAAQKEAFVAFARAKP